MGVVHEARHRYIGRRAAIKFLHPEIARDARHVERFLGEARAVNHVGHPGLVEIYEFGLLDDGRPYLIMEFLDGESLEKRLRRDRRLYAEAPWIGRQIALAMSAAHAKGIVHRDLKPDNVMLVPDDGTDEQQRVRIFDFGIAKLAPDTGGERLGGYARTRTGHAMGTAEYMAPEQCTSASDVDGRADVYALGVMLYRMIGGRVPFSSDLAVETMTLQVKKCPPLLDTIVPSLPRAVSALVHHMLAKQPVDRPTMREVADELLALAPLMVAVPPLAPSEALTRSPDDEVTRDPRKGTPVTPPSRETGSAAPSSVRSGWDSQIDVARAGTRGTRLAVGLTLLACLGAALGARLFMAQPRAATATTTSIAAGPSPGTKVEATPPPREPLAAPPPPRSLDGAGASTTSDEVVARVRRPAADTRPAGLRVHRFHDRGQ